MAAAKTRTVSTGEAAIFGRVWDQSANKLTPAVAKHVLKLGFSQADQKKLHELLEKNREGQLAPSEAEELDGYIKVGDLIAIIQSKARLALKKQNKSKQTA